uniref:EAL domain-containing protein n=1 Tax=Marinobacterium profundum TaxID=1714300 RepID=UPI0008359CD1|nr:EAL domain-containing protein [Marinobacterium profundum]
MKLSRKIPLVIIPLIAGPMLLLGLLAYLQLKDSAETRGIQSIDALLTRIDSQLQQIMTTADANIALFADDSLLKSYLLTDDLEERYALMQRPLQQKFSSIQRAYPDYYEIRVLAPDGFEDLRLSTRNDPNLTEDDSHSPSFLAFQRRTNDDLARVEINPDNQQLALFVTRRIRLINPAIDSFQSEAALRGYLSITIDLAPVLELLNASSWPNALLVLSTSQGDILGSTQGHSMDVLLHDYKLESIIMPQPPMLQPMLDGQPYLHHARQLHTNLWGHFLLPERELVRESRFIGLLVLAVCVSAIVFSIPLLLVLVRKQMLDPIGRLNQALASLGDKQQLIQVPVQSEDEIGELSRSFNGMSRALQSSNEKIRTLAFRDSLTGLPNRLMFNRTLRRELEAARQHKHHIAVLFLDLDNFKNINDTLGHPAGDQLLVRVSEIIQANLRGYDSMGRPTEDDANHEMARFGGDEFTLLLRYLHSPDNVIPVVERILAALTHPIDLNGTPCYAGCSIGIAVYPEDGNSGDDLIKHADLAMYQAKASRRGGYEFFSSTTAEHARKRAQIIQKMHQAVEQQQFELYYQPIIDSRSRRLSSVEALIRWNDPELGPISPAWFIPLAEENGLILPIGAWVMEQAARQQQAWKEAGLPSLRIAINISSIQLQQKGFAQQLTQLLRKYELSSRDIYIELTETALIQGQDLVLENLYALHELGIQIALDDFGTGYSSLSYLQNLPIDILKIDRSFIINLQEKNNGLILSAIITMAHSLNMKVVAEGVEDEDHLAFLSAEGCDLLQGYLFGRPCPPADIEHLLANQEPVDAEHPSAS